MKTMEEKILQEFCDKFGIQPKEIASCCKSTEFCLHFDNPRFDCTECGFLKKNVKIYPKITAEKREALEELIARKLADSENRLSFYFDENEFFCYCLGFTKREARTRTEALILFLIAMYRWLEHYKEAVKKIVQA